MAQLCDLSYLLLIFVLNMDPDGSWKCGFNSKFSCFFGNRADGVMRTMNTEKLLKTVPIIQNQMDALLDFNVS